MTPIESADSHASTLWASDAADGARLDGFESFAEYYNRLAEYNRGTRTGRNRADRTLIGQRDNTVVFDTVASRLELTRYQRSRARIMFGRLDLRKLSTPNGIDVYVVAFMVCAVACRDDGRLYHPNRGDNDELFVELADDLEIVDRLARSAYSKIIEAIEA
jgi:hypothetical protein